MLLVFILLTDALHIFACLHFLFTAISNNKELVS